MYIFNSLLFLLLLFGCQPKQESSELCLVSINLITSEGLSETISNQERLKRFQEVDFLCPQPYQKVLRVYQKQRNSDIFAFVTSYHPNGQLSQYLEVVNGRAYGAYREWFADGTLKVQACVIGGEADLTTAAEKTWLFDGVCFAWDEGGCLVAEIPYSKGVLEGPSIHYHKNGKIWQKTSFEKGVVCGLYEIYCDDGRLLARSAYSNGKLNGESVRFWNENQSSAKELFCDGLLMQGNYFDLCGNLIAEIQQGFGFRAIFGREAVAELHEYKHGILEGSIQIFGKNERVIKKYHLKNGIKHGEEVEYYQHPSAKSLQPKLLLTWYEGKLQGVTKTWYDNGILESQRELSDNVKNGLFTAWYRDGNLMLIEEYDRNKLVRGEYFKIGEKIPLSVVNAEKGTATLFDGAGNFLRKVTYFQGKPIE